VSDAGEHPVGGQTILTLPDLERGVWRVNPAVAASIAGGDRAFLERHALHYARRLSEGGKYPLMVWPYHAMLGGIGHALVSAVEEAIFFHTIARRSQARFEIKGDNPLTENYSALEPEVMDTFTGAPVAAPNQGLLEWLLGFDMLIVAGQAKSHCVAWTIDNLLAHLTAEAPGFVGKVYLLEDCTSPVVVPGVIDFTDQASAAFKRFADAGMNVVRSTQPMARWP
jgi:nicotinamidase-related amidase